MPVSSESSSNDPAIMNPLANQLRLEVVSAELQILELKDRLLAIQTDRSDAVALLGQAELLLEQKISYIITLDQTLNARIRELEAEADRKTEEIDRRGTRISEIEAREKSGLNERDTIIGDLSQRLETANQEINRAHQLARDLDLKRATAEEKTKLLSAQLSDAVQNLKDTTNRLNSSAADLSTSQSNLTALEAQLAETQNRLQKTESQLAVTRARVNTITASSWWRLGRPWRALFGPKDS